MSLKKLIVYSVVLVYFISSLKASTELKHVDKSKVPENLRKYSQFRFHFFTIWNFILLMLFMFVAILDEGAKLVRIPALQNGLEMVRHNFFSALVLPSSLTVSTIFWGLWHMNREFIFPKILDDFYPSWLNHTLHTFILIPVAFEIWFQCGNKNYNISRIKVGLVMTFYGIFYQTLYLSVYFRFGEWLYPVYRYMNWPERIAFVLFQYLLLIAYQQIGISLINGGKAKDTEAKLK